jgi:hypothetical protein
MMLMAGEQEEVVMKQHASRPRVARLLVDENRSWELIAMSIRSTTSCSSKTYSETRNLFSFLYDIIYFV